MAAPAPDAASFWADVARIYQFVNREIKQRDARLWRIQLTTGAHLAHAGPLLLTIESVLRYTGRLLDLPVTHLRTESEDEASPLASVSRPGQESGSRQAAARPDSAMNRFLMECREVLLKERKCPTRKCPTRKCPTLDEFHSRGDEVLMENLTAAWLALYFLGVPFDHPWEKVRRMAEYRGGLPSGGCVAKYVGDVYRAARHGMIGRDRLYKRAGLDPECVAKERARWQMLVLSHVPYVLLKGLLSLHDEDDLTPTSVHGLGRLYAVLQMRLYFDHGYPVKMLVPATALNGGLDKLNRPALEGIGPWLDTLFRHRNEQQSVGLLLQSEVTTGMPTCILGPDTGIYTLEAGNSGLHFSGNQIRQALLQSYRQKLVEVARTAEHDLLQLQGRGPANFNRTLRDVLHRA